MGAEELTSGRDAQFAEDFPKMVVHGIGAEVELGGNLGAGRTNRGQAGYVFFLRREMGIGFSWDRCTPRLRERKTGADTAAESALAAVQSRRLACSDRP